jgi:uncharacterized membrane protein
MFVHLSAGRNLFAAVLLLFAVILFAPLAEAQNEPPPGYSIRLQGNIRTIEYDLEAVPHDRFADATEKLLGLARPAALLGMVAGLALLVVGIFSASHKPATSGGITLFGSALLYTSEWLFAVGVVVFLIARQLYLQRKREREEELERLKLKRKNEDQAGSKILGGVNLRTAVRGVEPKKKSKKKRSDDEDLDGDAEPVFKEPDVHIKLSRPV